MGIARAFGCPVAEILGIWIEQTKGAKFRRRVMNELRNWGVTDILIAVVDGLKGFPDAINAVFPKAVVQTCIVHIIRNSMSFASWKDRKAVAQERLSRRKCQGGPDCAGGVRAKLLGAEISGPLAKLAPALRAGHPVLCVQCSDPADHFTPRMRSRR